MDNNIREDQQLQDDESQKSRFAEKRAPKRSTEEQDQKLAASSFDQDKIEVAPTPKAELPQALEVSLAHDYNTLDVDANHDLSLSPRNEQVESEATWNRVMLKNKGREKLIKASNDYSPSSVRQKLNHVRVKSTKANSPTRLSARAMESAQRVYKYRGARNNSQGSIKAPMPPHMKQQFISENSASKPRPNYRKPTENTVKRESYNLLTNQAPGLVASYDPSMLFQNQKLPAHRNNYSHIPAKVKSRRNQSALNYNENEDSIG